MSGIEDLKQRFAKKYSSLEGVEDKFAEKAAKGLLDFGSGLQYLLLIRDASRGAAYRTFGFSPNVAKFYQTSVVNGWFDMSAVDAYGLIQLELPKGPTGEKGYGMVKTVFLNRVGALAIPAGNMEKLAGADNMMLGPLHMREYSLLACIQPECEDEGGELEILVDGKSAAGNVNPGVDEPVAKEVNWSGGLSYLSMFRESERERLAWELGAFPRLHALLDAYGLALNEGYAQPGYSVELSGRGMEVVPRPAYGCLEVFGTLLAAVRSGYVSANVGLDDYHDLCKAPDSIELSDGGDRGTWVSSGPNQGWRWFEGDCCKSAAGVEINVHRRANRIAAAELGMLWSDLPGFIFKVFSAEATAGKTEIWKPCAKFPAIGFKDVVVGKLGEEDDTLVLMSQSRSGQEVRLDWRLRLDSSSLTSVREAGGSVYRASRGEFLKLFSEEGVLVHSLKLDDSDMEGTCHVSEIEVIVKRVELGMVVNEPDELAVVFV